MNKLNKITLKQIKAAQNNLLPKSMIFARQCGKSGIILGRMQLFSCYEIAKDWVRNSDEHISFEQVNDSIKKSWEESEEENEDD